MLGLVSRLNHRLFATHPVTRSALAEALVSKLTIGLPADRLHDIYISRADLFRWLIQTDPSASVLSYMRVWCDFANRVTIISKADHTSNGQEPSLKIRIGDTYSVIESIIREVGYGTFQSMDEQDENLRHLFEELPMLPPAQPRMDIQGRLATTADDKLERIAAALEPIQALVQRMFEEQSIAAILARQNQLALEDFEEQIKQLRATQQPIQCSALKEMTMAEKIVKAATETSTGVLSAIQEGGKISLSQKANKGVVEVFHKHLGHHIPGATSPVGKKIEALAIPSILHFGAAMLSDKVPHVDVIQRACLRAITGESKDGMDGIINVLMPVFQEILAGEGIVGEAMKEMSKVEVAKVEQAPAVPQLSAHEAQTLMASFLEQMKNAKPGEPVEIKLTLPARALEESKPLVPPFAE